MARKARRPSNHLCVAAALPPSLPLSLPSFLSLPLPPSFLPLRPSSPFHIVECSRIRQHACDIPVPVGICLSFINANKAIIVDEWRGRLDIPLMARCRIRRGYPRSDVSMASNRSPILFFFFQPWNKPSSTIDLGCREPSPSFQNGVGWEKSCNDRRNFRIYLAHGPSKQLLNISGTDNTSAEGKQRVVVFRRRNNPSQIKTRKQTRERDAGSKTSFHPPLPSPILSLALLIRRAIPRFQSSSVRKCRGGGGWLSRRSRRLTAAALLKIIRAL